MEFRQQGVSFVTVTEHSSIAAPSQNVAHSTGMCFYDRDRMVNVQSRVIGGNASHARGHQCPITLLCWPVLSMGVRLSGF
jgi:hypothetical protein